MVSHKTALGDHVALQPLDHLAEPYLQKALLTVLAAWCWLLVWGLGSSPLGLLRRTA